MGASSLESARSKLPKGTNTLLHPSLATQDDRALIQQGVKYAIRSKAPYVIFYDYDFLFALEPPRELLKTPPNTTANVLMDVVLFKEANKSTKSQMVQMQENHVSILLKYKLKAVSQAA